MDASLATALKNEVHFRVKSRCRPCSTPRDAAHHDDELAWGISCMEGAGFGENDGNSITSNCECNYY